MECTASTDQCNGTPGERELDLNKSRVSDNMEAGSGRIMVDDDGYIVFAEGDWADRGDVLALTVLIARQTQQITELLTLVATLMADKVVACSQGKPSYVADILERAAPRDSVVGPDSYDIFSSMYAQLFGE
jgi:hypothetical protein